MRAFSEPRCRALSDFSGAGAVDWNGPRRQTCPGCGRGPRDKTLGVTLDERGGVAHCHRCNYVANLFHDDARVRPGRSMPRASAGVRYEVLSDFGRALWRECLPIVSTARSYLEARRCVIPPADGDLRFHPALKHPPSGVEAPALVALVTDAVSGVPLSLHRTWIRADGAKADFDPPRMLLGGHRKAGGVVRLWPDEAVTHGLGIAEGIETALSLAHAYQPAWALIDAGNMAGMPVLAGIDSLLIAADHDEAGVAAANECACRWADAGREVGIVMPERRKSDLNDMARAA